MRNERAPRGLSECLFTTGYADKRMFSSGSGLSVAFAIVLGIIVGALIAHMLAS